MPAHRFHNALLQHLPPEVITRLQLRPTMLPLNQVLESTSTNLNSVFFLEDGIACLTTEFEDGTQIETGMFGSESVIGISGMMGVRKSFNKIVMQLAGTGYASPVQLAREEFRRNGIFQSLALRYVQVQLTLSNQNAACNALHSAEQRLARWLLICCDRGHNPSIKMSQEFISQLVGSTRSTVSIAATSLKNMGYIDYSRGTIRILDSKGLETQACECYRVVRTHLENLREFDSSYIL